MSQKVVVLVTGATGGIGNGIVFSMAAHFAKTLQDHKRAFTFLVSGRNQDGVSTSVTQLRGELEGAGSPSVEVEGLVMDIDDDDSIEGAVEEVKQRFGQLNVLVNNAAIAKFPQDSLEGTRSMYQQVLNTNVVSVANTVAAFAPLLQTTGHGLVINISSARGSIERLSDPKSPKTASIPYSVSKVALNGLTLELAKQFEGIEFQIAAPGHCKTMFNNYRGARDPREGATVATLLVESWLSAPSDCGFWETVGDAWELSRIPW